MKTRTYRIARNLVVAAALNLPYVLLAQPTLVPYIEGLSQPSVAPNLGPLTLTIMGVGFSNGSNMSFPPAMVQIKGPAGTDILTVSTGDEKFGGFCFIGACTQLTVTIPAADTATAGTATIEVLNPFPPPMMGSTPPPIESNVVLFPISTKEQNILAGNVTTTNGVGQGAQGIAFGDFNEDGKPDVAVVNTSDNTVSILLGNGDGTFSLAPGSPIMLGNNLQPVAVAAGDFHNQQHLDLIVVNENANSFTILRNNGDRTGNFTVGNSFDSKGQQPVAVAVADFDLDGNLDVVVLNKTNAMGVCPPLGTASNGSQTLYYGDGMGGFGNSPSHPADMVETVCLGTSPDSVAVGDFNGDGFPDIVVANSGGGGGNSPGGSAVSCNPGEGTVSVLINGQNFMGMTFTNDNTFCAGQAPTALAVSDFNNDALLDVAVSNLTDNSVTVLLGAPHGSESANFLAPLNFHTGSQGPTGIAVGDFNSDQFLDLAVSHQAAGDVVIMVGDGSGKFSFAGDFASGSTLNGITVADFNGDGRLDVAGTSVVVNPNGPPAPATLPAVIVMLQNPPLTLSQQCPPGIPQGSPVCGPPGSLNFGNVPENDSSGPLSITITNNASTAVTLGQLQIQGANSSSFALTADNCSNKPLSPSGGTCTFSVTFTPIVIGQVGAAVEIPTPLMASNSVMQFASLSGTGVAEVLTSTPLDVTFTDQLVGTTSSAMLVTISNVSGINNLSATLQTASITGMNPGDFSQNGGCDGQTLVASGLPMSCSINVTFTPSGGGARSATLSIGYLVSGGTGTVTLNVNLFGNGTAPLVSLSSSPLTFANQEVGTTSSPAPVLLTNLGTAPLTISNILITGSDFVIQSESNCGTVAVNSSCTVNVTFTPTAAGPRNGALTFTDNNQAVNGKTQIVSLTGTGTTPIATLSTNTLSFNGVPITTTSAPLSFLLTNTGTAPLKISSISIPAGDFAQTNNCLGVLGVNANCTISATLKPSVVGARNATLTITDDDHDVANSMQMVSLSGTGTDFTIAASPNSVTISPGKFATYTVTITPVDGFTGTLSLACNISPSAPKTTCTVPSSVVVNGGNAVFLSATAKNSSRGTFTITYTATLTETSPASGKLTHTSVPVTLVVK